MNLKRFRAWFATNAWLPLLALVAAVVLWQLVDPAPPRELTIATGSHEGRYYRLGKYLERELAAQGFKVKVVATAGSGENMALLSDPQSDVTIAFVQSGMEEMYDREDANLASLGSLYYEPIWLFYRTDQPLVRLTDLRGRTVGIGAPGSGTQMVARYLAAETGLSQAEANVSFAEHSEDRAVALLAEGQLDAALFTVSPASERIQSLIALPGVDFLDIRRSEAYTARFAFLSSVTVWQGLLDLERNIPDVDRTTLASTAMLVVNERFHPSLTPLILDALTKVLKKGGVLEKPNEFPSAKGTDFALTNEADHFYEYGPPFLQRYLPFWAASLVDRLVIFVIPLLVILIPASKLAGPVYRWRIRSRIYKWYRHLLETDRKIAEGEIKDPQAERERLKAISDELAAIEVPLPYADELYRLKQHLEYMDMRLQRCEHA